ncbi:cupredoxin family protein [Rhizobium sp. KVB221]|uniref:Cupredoxin family protein n=1 Tax=Rhizobium setariae TaxID=2801340 RepID=A0A937CPT7_9HYPH|nr:cupredoxin family protein [Rhizobium setariae]MBL0373569.1 cupredoxin family protein [Rhizobium setariae]
MLKQLWTTALALSLLSATALAHDHQHGVAPVQDEVMLGVPGDASDVSETVVISMKETPEGGMLFEPAIVSAKAGETLRLLLRNNGETDHEFILAGPEELEEHREMMKEFPDMHHEDANSIRLAPGSSGEIIWKFGQSGSIDFACLIPGHYEAGMHGRVDIGAK